MNKNIGIFLFTLSLFLLGTSPVFADAGSLFAKGATQASDDSSVMQAFTSHDDKATGVLSVNDKTKRLVMFIMGVPLILLLAATIILGVAMGVYGKQVFVAHMICAGLSMTLAIAHTIVGIVWFFPF